MKTILRFRITCICLSNCNERVYLGIVCYMLKSSEEWRIDCSVLSRFFAVIFADSMQSVCLLICFNILFLRRKKYDRNLKSGLWRNAYNRRHKIWWLKTSNALLDITPSIVQYAVMKWIILLLSTWHLYYCLILAIIYNVHELGFISVFNASTKLE